MVDSRSKYGYDTSKIRVHYEQNSYICLMFLDNTNLTNIDP
jgi:hypothetical protein